MRKLAIILLSFTLICLFNYKNIIFATEPLDLTDIDIIQRQVDLFYTDSEKSMISDSITKEYLEKISSAISQIKSNLEDINNDKINEIIFDLKNAERLFSIRSLVRSLFDQSGFVLDNANLLEAHLAVSTAKEEYPDFCKKELDEIIKAEGQKKEIEEKTKILNTLFTDESRQNVLDNITRENYNEVLNSINVMTVTPYKEKFLNDISIAEKIILEKERIQAEADAKAREEAEIALKKVMEAEPKYLIKVSKRTHIMSIYSRDESGNHTILKAEYKVATGRTPGLTPVGTFTLGTKQLWHEWWSGGSASPYTTSYANGLYIHGPIYRSKNFNTVFPTSVSEIGFNKTSGCIRTSVEAAKFVYDNCVQGTTIEITN